MASPGLTQLQDGGADACISIGAERRSLDCSIGGFDLQEVGRLELLLLLVDSLYGGLDFLTRMMDILSGGFTCLLEQRGGRDGWEGRADVALRSR